MNYIKRIFNHIDNIGWIYLFFYPLTNLITTTIRLIQTIWYSRVLLNGKWEHYTHFAPYSAINSLFYATAALNINRHGICGKSPTLGLGNISLSKGFHYTFISLFAYWRAGAITLIIGMFGWWLSHSVWFYITPAEWVYAVLLMTVISTTFFGNVFILQNYNVLGWLFVPLALYSLHNSNYLYLAISQFLISLGSFTGTLLVIAIVSVSAITNHDWTLLYCSIPAMVKLSIHVLPLLQNKNLVDNFMYIAKAIGLIDVSGNPKYKRHKRIMIKHVYFFLLYAQYGLVLYFVDQSINWWIFTGIVLFLVNIKARFADDQSLYMLMFSLIVATIMIHPYNWTLLFSSWLALSPLPKAIGGGLVISSRQSFPSLMPFSIEKLLEEVNLFLQPAQRGNRIIFTFNEPTSSSDIYDGYRIFLEIPLYIAAQRGIHLLPDWWAVFETNYQGAPNFWGRDVETVKVNVEKWEADFVIIYRPAGRDIDSCWEENGFRTCSKLSWKVFEEHMINIPCTAEPFDWWLLRVPKIQSVQKS